MSSRYYIISLLIVLIQFIDKINASKTNINLHRYKHFLKQIFKRLDIRNVKEIKTFRNFD